MVRSGRESERERWVGVAPWGLSRRLVCHLADAFAAGLRGGDEAGRRADGAHRRRRRRRGERARRLLRRGEVEERAGLDERRRGGEVAGLERGRARRATAQRREAVTVEEAAEAGRRVGGAAAAVGREGEVEGAEGLGVEVPVGRGGVVRSQRRAPKGRVAKGAELRARMARNRVKLRHALRVLGDQVVVAAPPPALPRRRLLRRPVVVLDPKRPAMRVGHA